MQREDGLLTTDDTDLGFLAVPYPAMREQAGEFRLQSYRLPPPGKSEDC